MVFFRKEVQIYLNLIAKTQACFKILNHLISNYGQFTNILKETNCIKLLFEFYASMFQSIILILYLVTNLFISSFPNFFVSSIPYFLSYSKWNHFLFFYFELFLSHFIWIDWEKIESKFD